MGFLFSPTGRLSRKGFWTAFVIYFVVAGIVGVLGYLLAQMFPGDTPEAGEFNVDGPAAIPFFILTFGYIVLSTWSWICVGIKRFHDRDKSGWWVLITFIPIIGSLWYLIETGFLAGTRGPNRFGNAASGV